MATIAPQKKPASPEKSQNEMSQRTISRRIKQLEDQVDALQDLAELQVEDVLERFHERRAARIAKPQVIYGAPPCGCQSHNGLIDSLLETAFWVVIGVVCVVVTKGKQIKSE